MNSSMSAGERRWPSARRGGKTVLGKVSVPKPLNLPSQRLENHGVDPTVEIVPKGTLSWGSRPSSSGSNPWISSPNADVGTISPSHPSGRPSSSGSGSRPSTAGSERTHEPVANAWGSKSRPSSASGTLPSNQTSSISLRPRSAETRPNSSQLSRFAEPVSESSVAWGPSITAERLGVKSVREDGFSLSSGDFPTLGSEKDNSLQSIESEDCRPSSASDRIAQAKGDAKSQADVKRGTVNTWRTDDSRSTEDDIHPSMERWQADPQQYFNANVAPQHFDAWRGPPINGPPGVWYRGRPQGPAFGAPVPPGGFPLEPTYYRPQIPPQPLAGSQPVPPPGACPRGPHTKNGDLYRPQMPNAYARPGMPFRPGFYSGHPGPPGPMAFEGYYGPPMGYCNNERDVPYMGMAAGPPPVYNGYPAPSAPDIGNSHGRAAGRGPSGKTLSERVAADHLEDTQGPKRVPLMNHNELDRKEEGENQEHGVQPKVLYTGKSSLPIISSRKREWGAEEDTEEAMFTNRTTPYENSSRSSEYIDMGHSADSVKVKSFEGTGNVKPVNDNWTYKSESVLSFPPEMPQLPLGSERDSSLPTTRQDPVLMQKIDGLNAKVRISDGQNESPSPYNREEQRDRPQIVDLKINNYTGEVSYTAESFETTPVSRDFVPASHEVIVPVGDKPIQPMAVVSRRSYHGGQGRVDHRGKGKFNSQDADGWRRKPLATESSTALTASNVESAPNIHPHDHPNFVEEAAENSMINPAGQIEGDCVETYDSTDIHAQRAKMRELAKQRALQLQKEEEERIRDQKAKALAKLEELNRRTLTGEAADQKAERTRAISDIHGGQEESRTLGEPVRVDPKFQEPSPNLVSNPDVISVDGDINTNQAGESVAVSRNMPLELQQKGLLEFNVSPLPVQEDTRNDNAKKAAPQLNDGGISRHKRTGYKKQNSSLQKSLNEKSVSNASEAQKDHAHVTTVDITLQEGPSSEIKPSGSNVPNTSNTVVEPSAHQRRKSNSSSKNKHELDETPALPTLPPVMSDTNPRKESIENGEPKESLSKLGSSVSTVIEPDRGLQAQEAYPSLPNKESPSRVAHQLKPQPSSRMPRSQQANRFMDKLHGSETVMWARVRTPNKAEVSVETSQKSIQESANPMKADNMAQNSSKGKRAEMERYVPKPVAKELAQQGSNPLLSSLVSPSRSEDGPGREQSGSVSSASQQPVSSATACVGSSVEINEGDARHVKHKKEHGTWRQRGSTDSSHTKGLHLGPPPISEPIKDIQQSKEQVKCEINSANTEAKTSGTIKTDDGYNMSKNMTTAAVSKYPAVKDQGATGKGKRHLPKGPRSTGNNHDPENTFSGEIDGSCVQTAAADVNETDRTIVSKDNRSFGERTSSHWQPKTHSNSANNQNGNRTLGSESVTTEINRLPKKDHPQHKVQVPPRHDKDSRNVNQPQPGQSVESNVAEESIAGYPQEFSREKKPAPAKGRPYSPNQDPFESGESTPAANTDDQRNISSGSRRNGSQNSRSVRGRDSHRDWSSGHDSRPQNMPTFRERHRQNVHYEYQPVGPYKGSKPEKVEEPADGADSVERRQKERGQSYSKRGGNFYKRQSGAVRVDSGQD